MMNVDVLPPSCCSVCLLSVSEREMYECIPQQYFIRCFCSVVDVLLA